MAETVRFHEPDEVLVPGELPVLPLQDTVLFPGTASTLSVGNPRSLRLLDEVAEGNRQLATALIRRRTPEPSPEDLHAVGTAAELTRLVRLPDGTAQVVLQGTARVRLTDFVRTEPYLLARVEPIRPFVEITLEVEALQRNVLDLFRRLVELTPELPDELATAAANIRTPDRLADAVAAVLNVPAEVKQELLETANVPDRLRHITRLLTREIEVLETARKIQADVRAQVERGQREYYLREQMRAIQRELGQLDEREAEINELRRAIEEAGMPQEARREAERELDRLARMPPAAPEHAIIRTYLEWLTSLPWNVSTPDRLDLREARRILDADHYDLERVKDRILENLAVVQLRGEVKGTVLCFLGPPGVGKTSLGQSIARAMGRHFVKVSLGGVRDEAEIRGHRRTYIGAMPGRIVQGIRRAGSNNPVFMLDEVDKLGVGVHGDPSAALLEVLDPAQNFAFVDHYLGVPFNLSRVFFIATANVLDTIPPPLRDRMEIISIAGYTEDEKLHIARQYLVPQQLQTHGLTREQLEIADDALRFIIQGYTREAGVRELTRAIATIVRRVARRIAEGLREKVVVAAQNVPEYLGPRRYRFEILEQADEIGVATGLAWTPVGGQVLFVEASVVPGRGNLILTGLLGDVMQESARAALTYARARAGQLGLPENLFEKVDVHIHVPVGAIPKDGPSAGITMATALISAATRRPARKEVAMTGEITLRGKVLPVGGIKEKVLAAHRAGATTVVLPRENEQDLEEVPAEVRESLRFVFVDHMDDVLAVALAPQPAATEVHPYHELRIAGNQRGTLGARGASGWQRHRARPSG
ncbi:MAG TPA: endopeptidase La [Chloroflexota bacterium]